MKGLRILHVVYSLNIGGLERVVIDLTKGFMKKGHIVSICCLNEKGVLGEELELEGIEMFSLGKRPGIAWNLPFRISKIIKKRHFNIIHTHNEGGLIYGATAALIARVPNIVHTEHGKEPGYEEKRILHMVEKVLHRKVKKVVAVSNDLRDRIAESSRTNGKRIAMILNGIDVEKYYRPESRKENRILLGIGPESFVIGNVARLVPLKNHQFLLAVFRELLRDLPNLRMMIIGDGPLREDLESYSRKIGISKSVKFLGERQDVPDLLAAFDLFVLPSLTEGTSITLLEAMASGTPIVASRAGGNSQIIENRKTGLLLPLDKPKAWVATIKSLIVNPDKGRGLSEMAKVEVKERFSLKAMVENYEKIYYY
jgi:sugar transferase (PEP-CTERM/EpsH1 system associated)